MKNMILPDFVTTIIAKLQSSGYEAYAAGGCVRDMLMGKTPADYDVATEAKPEQVIAALYPLKIIETGIKHGTVTVLINGHSVEITTFRSDGEYTDNRHPKSVSFDAGVFEDTSRRDFTINAMMYNHDKGIVDHHGGITDIKSKLIRCVGYADERFNEDALRILRALRFASNLGFDIEPLTAAAAINNRLLLQNISAERITSELIKILCGDFAKKVISKHFEIIKSLIPGLSDKEHISALIDACPKKDYIRLAALLHYNEGFSIPSCLRFDNTTKHKITKLISHFDENILPDKRLLKSYMRKLMPSLLFDLFDLQLAEAVMLNKDTTKIIQAKKLLQQLIDSNECYTLSMLAVGGDDLIEHNIAHGKEIGSILETLLDAVVDEKVQNEKQALLQYATTLVKN